MDQSPSVGCSRKRGDLEEAAAFCQGSPSVRKQKRFWLGKKYNLVVGSHTIDQRS